MEWKRLQKSFRHLTDIKTEVLKANKTCGYHTEVPYGDCSCPVFPPSVFPLQHSLSFSVSHLSHHGNMDALFNGGEILISAYTIYPDNCHS